MNSSSRVGRASDMIQEAMLANDCSSASTRQMAADTGENTEHRLVADCKCN